MVETVRVEQHGAVALVTMARAEAMNSFNAELRADLLAALQRVGAEASVRVVVLTGEGRSFSAGADLKAAPTGRTVEETLLEEYQPILKAVATMEKPVIAAVGGSAAGIGMSLALTCDLVVMADDAFLLAPFTNISLVPDGALSWLLVRQLGYRKAFEIAISSERIAAARCLELGLANRTAPAATLLDDTMEWAAHLAGRAPLSIAATKKTMRFAAENDWSATFALEAAEQGPLRASADHKEGVAAFLEKRPPAFKGA